MEHPAVTRLRELLAALDREHTSDGRRIRHAPCVADQIGLSTFYLSVVDGTRREAREARDDMPDPSGRLDVI